MSLSKHLQQDEVLF